MPHDPREGLPEMGWFSIHQNGMKVVGGSGTLESVKREAAHFAAIYGQDGPVKVTVRRYRANRPASAAGKDLGDG